MMSEQRPEPKITLEDLLRVKRAERPPADFWADFDRELRTRQLAAAVEKKRWWFALPRVLTGLSRYQLPMGAAAVFAVTFLTVREYREPGFQPEYTAPAAAASVLEAEEAELGLTASPSTVVVAQEPVVDPIELPTARVEPVRRTPAVAVATNEPEPARAEPVLTPSARSIAVNLAAVEPEMGSLLGSRVLKTTTKPVREPLAELTALRDARREPLFAYNSDLSVDSADRDASRATDRIGSRISETELYDTVRRLSGGADRLTLRF